MYKGLSKIDVCMFAYTCLSMVAVGAFVCVVFSYCCHCTVTVTVKSVLITH